jgi:hypothetical protein
VAEERTRMKNKNNDNQMKHDMAHCQQFISLELSESEEKLLFFICC